MRTRFLFLFIAALALLVLASRSGLRAARPLLSTASSSASASEAATPVLVELFTSEGCSDCPPADALLARLDRSRLVPSAGVVVLSEHVDYWNELGWPDPFSSHDFSVRQDAYASRFRLPSVYTPQMIVDGRFQLVGSDEPAALSAIASAARNQKIRVVLSNTRWSSAGEISLHVEADPLPPSASAKSALLWIAAADDSDDSRVPTGENGGRTLHHVAVLRSFRRAASVSSTSGFSGDISLSLPSSHARSLRLIAVVQDPSPGPVFGLASASLP